MFSLIKKLIPQSLLNTYHYLTSLLFHYYYGQPSKHLKIIGVTGTDGKTTTSNLVYEVLQAAGFKTGLVSTINAKIGGKEYDTGFHTTSPDPKDVHNYLRLMQKEGAEYCVLETTSHALYQNRYGPVKYIAGVYTNITHEHLDQHHTYENYLLHKAKLMKKIHSDGFVVLNRDDQSFDKLSEIAKTLAVKVITYGFQESADIVVTDFTEGKFTISNKLRVTSELPGKYNVSNIIAAYAVAHELGVKDEVFIKAVKQFKNLKGRWEVIQALPFKVVVDFAHTPNALERVLSYAKTQVKLPSKLITVFGTAGLRDSSKRPLMGKAASTYSDIVILTAEDPRGEDVNSINQQISDGFVPKFNKSNYKNIPDRREAISAALSLAKKDDIVIITGKGHEQSLNIDGKTEIPWSDQKVTKELLKI